MRVNLFFTSSYEGVYLKAESSNKNTEYMPGGQVKPNFIAVFDKKSNISSEIIVWQDLVFKLSFLKRLEHESR